MAWYDFVAKPVKKVGGAIKDAAVKVKDAVTEGIPGVFEVAGEVYGPSKFKTPKDSGPLAEELEAPSPENSKEEISTAVEEVTAVGRSPSVFAGRRERDLDTLETKLARRSLLGI